MKIDEIMNDIVKSSTYKKEVGTSFQLGLPQFFLHNNELFVLFYPHIEKFYNNIVSFYSPNYEIILIYPFRHIVLFKNLFYATNSNFVLKKEPACKIHIDDIASNVNNISDLFSIANDIICAREEKANDLQYLLLKYRKQYFLTSESIGLKAVYGGAYDSYRCL